MRRFLLLGFLSLTVAGSSRWDADGQAWWDNVEYLASDELQGRNVGTHGFDLAANFVATQYERTGLKAAGNDGYFQRVWFTNTWLVSANLEVQRDGKSLAVLIPAEAEINFSAQSIAGVRARVVFAGYGLKIPEADYDDFKGLPMQGAVVAYLTGGPAEISSNLRAHYGSSEVRWEAMRAAGAIGMIAIPNPKEMKTPWAHQMRSWGNPRMALMEPQMNAFSGLQLNVTWNPADADDLLSGSGHNFAQILAAAQSQSGLPHFATGGSIKADVLVRTHLVPSKNVVAVHRGSDESLRNEYVVVSAHLDHLGMTGPTHSDIFHGAMDDAAGVSSVIEIAKKLKNVATKRSILFLALTGEEKGDLGSAYFARFPSVTGRIVADLNMDMFLPLYPLRWLEVQGLDESTMGGDVRAVADAAGVQVQSDREPNRNRFLRSDQYSFVKAGIPALAFKFGFQKGDPAEKVVEHWYASRYHGVKDDARQPVDLKAAADFNNLLQALLVRIADADEAPRWQADSFFRRFETSVDRSLDAAGVSARATK